MTKQIKNKFNSHATAAAGPSDRKIMSKQVDGEAKYRSHSHGALPSLDEFSQVNKRNNAADDDEDDINGIWSASQLASKQAKVKKASPIQVSTY